MTASSCSRTIYKFITQCLYGESNDDQNEIIISDVENQSNTRGQKNIRVNNEESNKEIKRLELENQENKKIINSQKLEIEKYKKFNQNSQLEIKRLNETISKDVNISNQFKKLNQQFLEKNEENQKLKLTISKYENQNKLLNEENQKSKLIISKYENQNKNLNNLLNLKNEEIRSLNNEINNLKKRLEDPIWKNQVGLVDVKVVLFPYPFKCLYPNGVSSAWRFHCRAFFAIRCKLT